MGVPAVFKPKVTNAGKAAAIDASNAGLTLRLTHVSFGVGQYDPTGLETALFNEVKRVPVTGAMRPRPNQLRVAGVWAAQEDESEIGEVGFWAGGVLFAVWSRAIGGPIGFKTLGVDFVSFYDLVFDEVPAGSIEIVINTDVSEALSALLVHEVADDAHTQYLLRAQFVDAHSLMTAQVVAGTANQIAITLPAETVFTEYKVGQQVVFVANSTNTGATTASVNAVGARSVRKNGSVPLSPGDIIAGAVYTLFFDGLAWQLSGGVGGGQIMTRTPFTATAGQTAFTASYVPGAIFIVQDGVLLDNNKYVANNGTSFTLNAGATAGQLIELISFKPFSVADTYTKAEADMRFLPAAQAKVLAPPGEVAFFAMEVAPSGWIKANGALISRTTYSDLFLAIGTRFGAGDGATTFRLPDLRGEFVRGWDDGRNVDTGRALGSTQADEFKSHSHLDPTGNTGGITQTNPYEVTPPGNRLPDYDYVGSAPTSNTGGAETRPRNIALLACIKI